MLPMVALLLLHSPAPTLSKPEKAALVRLHRTLQSASDKKAFFLRFEREQSAANTPLWSRLVRKVKPNSEAYAECSFALAYYGVDYAQNIHRLLRPYHVWQATVIRPVRPGSIAYQWDRAYPYDTYVVRRVTEPLEWVPFSLNLLYLKHHDLAPLKAWLSLSLDGHWAEGNDDELGDLWGRHKRDMVVAAYGSTSRINNLLEALYFVNAGSKVSDYKATAKSLSAQVKRLTYDANPQVARSAHAPLPAVRREGRRQIEWARKTYQ